MVTEERERRITLRFRIWWLRHRHHLIVQYYGTTFCAKCQVPAPYPFKEDL